jgi:predicted GNAT superfamily acetyltransferase
MATNCEADVANYSWLRPKFLSPIYCRRFVVADLNYLNRLTFRLLLGPKLGLLS